MFICTLMAQPYLMGTVEVIKPAQLLDKEPAKLSCMVAAMTHLVLIATCCMVGGLLIFV